MGNVLTFDFGTTYFKVCLFDEEAQLLERVRIATPLETPRQGRVEFPVAAFQQTVLTATDQIASRCGGLSHIDRVSFASQANTFTLLDKNAAPLIPFLLWSDDRAVALAPLSWLGVQVESEGLIL